MRSIFCLLVIFISVSSCYGEPVAQYDPVTGEYRGCSEIGDSRVWLSDPNDMSTWKAGFIYVPDGCGSILPGISVRHIKVKNGNIIEMTQSEKDAVDAPILAARQQRIADAVELAALRQEMDNAYANWDALPPTQKIEAARKLIRLNQLERRLNGT